MTRNAAGNSRCGQGRPREHARPKPGLHPARTGKSMHADGRMAGGLSHPIIDRLNAVAVTPDDIAAAIALDERLVESLEAGGSIDDAVLDDLFRTNAETAQAAYFRMRALATLVLAPESAAWTLPADEDGRVPLHEPLLAAAATHPLVLRDGAVVFDRNAFFRRLVTGAITRGAA